MNRIHASGALGLLLLAGLSGRAAAAAPGPYLGGNLGQARASIDDRRIVDGLQASGFTTTAIGDNNRDLGYKLFAGYQFNPYLALEGGYVDLGKFGFHVETLPPGTLDGTTKLHGGNVDLVGMVPIVSRLSVFARVGAVYLQTRDRFRGTGAVHVLEPRRNKYATNYKFGLGLEYAVTNSFGLRAEAERYRVSDAVGNHGDIDLFSVGALYRFGQTPAQPVVVQRVVAPEPAVAVAPAPEPVPAPPPPPPPLPTRVRLSADSLFGFDRAEVNPAGKSSLDALAASLKGAKFEQISVTGHSDRIGRHDYNLKLSTRRALAVKDYLVQQADIPADKIVAVGKDGAEPVTQPGDCPGRKTTPRLIACLQPDRRVDIEVSGTR
ncbi:MAG: porin OmpA [Nevskia sp.]